VAARHRRDHRADRRAAHEQLEDVLGADGLQLTAEERARLEAPAPPSPVYPRWMLRGQTGIRDVPSLARTR
jgi:hypothetical protein